VDFCYVQGDAEWGYRFIGREVKLRLLDRNVGIDKGFSLVFGE